MLLFVHCHDKTPGQKPIKDIDRSMRKMHAFDCKISSVIEKSRGAYDQVRLNHEFTLILQSKVKSRCFVICLNVF